MREQNAREQALVDEVERRQSGQAHKWRGVILGLAVSMLLLTGYVLLSDYAGRVDDTDDSVRGCLRSTADRLGNAWGWRNAQQARQRGDKTDQETAVAYGVLARGFEERAGVALPVDPDDPLPRLLAATESERERFCDAAFPKPSLLPWTR